MLAEELRIDFGPEPQREHRRGQPARRDQARQQRRGGRDDDTHVAGGDRRKHPRACGRHVEVRREPAIRVDLVRGQRQHRARGRAVVEALECRQEESRVGGGLFGVRVGGDDEHDESIARLMRAKRRVQRASCRRQAGDRAAVVAEPRAAGGRSKQGLKREGRGGRHDRRDLTRDRRPDWRDLKARPTCRRIFARMSVVEWPGSIVARTTRPPRASTTSRPTI